MGIPAPILPAVPVNASPDDVAKWAAALNASLQKYFQELAGFEGGGGGMGGTTVVANPTGGPFATDLTGITIEGTSYNVGGGGGGGGSPTEPSISQWETPDTEITTTGIADLTWQTPTYSTTPIFNPQSHALNAANQGVVVPSDGIYRVTFELTGTRNSNSTRLSALARIGRTRGTDTFYSQAQHDYSRGSYGGSFLEIDVLALEHIQCEAGDLLFAEWAVDRQGGGVELTIPGRGMHLVVERVQGPGSGGMGGGGTPDGVLTDIQFTPALNKRSIAVAVTRSAGHPVLNRSFDVFSGDYSDLTNAPPIPTNADIDARINALVPLADVQATHAVTSFAGAWDDRHSWTPHQIADYIVNLRAGGDQQHRDPFVPDSVGVPVGDVLAVVDTNGAHAWMAVPPSILEPDAAGNLPLATADDIGQFAREHNDLRIGRTVVTHPATTLAVGYTPIPESGSYRGVRYQGSDVGNPNNEDVVFSWRYGRFEAYNEFQSFWGIIANPTTLPTDPPLPMVWRGDWGTQNEASEHVRAVGDVVYIDTHRPRQLLRVTSYTPDAPEQRQNVWSPTDDILTLRQRADDLEAREQLPDTQGRSAGLSVVTAAGGGYTLSNIMGGGGGTPTPDNRLVPPGGSVGFYLGKVGPTDFDTGWINVNQSLTEEGVYNILRNVLLPPADNTVTLALDPVAHTIRPSAAAAFDLNTLPELPSTGVLSNPDKLLMADASDGNTMKSLTAAQAANHFQPNIQQGSVLVSTAAQIIEFTDDITATAVTPNHVRASTDITAKVVGWLTGSQLTPNINHRFITYSPADANTIRYSTIDDLRTYMVDTWARPNTPGVLIPEAKLPPIDYNDLTNRPTIPTDTNNYVTGGSVSGTTLTLERQGLPNVDIPGLPSGGRRRHDVVPTSGRRGPSEPYKHRRLTTNELRAFLRPEAARRS